MRILLDTHVFLWYISADAQLPRDLTQWQGGVLKAHGGSAGNDSKVSDFRQMRDQLIGHRVGKEFL